MQASPTEIQYRFGQCREELRQLFVEDLAESQRLQLDWRSYLRHLFQQITAIVELKEVAAFQRYLENQDNLPVHINATSLRFDEFEELLQRWLDFRKLSLADMAESFYISEEDHTDRKEFRNIEFRDVVRTNQRLISNFTASQRDKKKLTQRQLADLLQLLFRHMMVYEWQADDQMFANKLNFPSAVREVINKYMYSPQRELKPFDTKELFTIAELPQLLRYWESVSPQLKVEGRLRLSTQEISVQTDATIPITVIKRLTTGSQTTNNALIRKTTLPQHIPHSRPQGKAGGLEQTLNSTIEKLQAHRQSLLNPDWVESVDYLLITLQKQRRRMYPHYKFRLHHPDLTSIGDVSHEQMMSNELNDYLQEIYEHYRKSPVRIVDETVENISFLGDYAQEVIEEQKKSEPLSYADFRKFLEDVGKFTGSKPAENLLRSNRLSRSVANHLTLDTFATMVKELLQMGTGLRQNSLVRFVKEKIRGVDEKATIEGKRKLGCNTTSKQLPKRKTPTPITNSPKKRKGSIDATAELLGPISTMLLYSGRDEPDLKKKKSINSPAYRRMSTKNPASPATTNTLYLRKKEMFSPYRYRQHVPVSSVTRESVVDGVFKKKGKGAWVRQVQN